MIVRMRNVVRGGLTMSAMFVAVTLVFLLVLTLLEVIPVRSFQAQRRDIAATSARLTMLKERNEALQARVAQLNTDTEIQRVALQQYRMVKPGQQVVLMPEVDSSPDSAVAPVPSAKEVKTPSRGRAIADFLMFWR